MTREKRQAFLRACDLDPALNEDQILWKFQHTREWHERMHNALGKRAEADKPGEANGTSAGFSRRTYYVAGIGIVIAVVAVVAALVK